MGGNTAPGNREHTRRRTLIQATSAQKHEDHAACPLLVSSNHIENRRRDSIMYRPEGPQYSRRARDHTDNISIPRQGKNAYAQAWSPVWRAKAVIDRTTGHEAHGGERWADVQQSKRRAFRSSLCCLIPSKSRGRGMDQGDSISGAQGAHFSTVLGPKTEHWCSSDGIS